LTLNPSRRGAAGACPPIGPPTHLRHRPAPTCLLQLGTVEAIRLTMQELYSSRVRTFRLRGRQGHPHRDGADLAASLDTDAWELLGEFTAENKRGTQVGAGAGEGRAARVRSSSSCVGRRAEPVRWVRWPPSG